LPPEEAESNEIAAKKVELEQLCVQLFECLGITYSEETVKQFVRSITKPEKTMTLNEEKVPNADWLHMGTHEYKFSDVASLLLGLMQLLKQKARPYVRLGKFALQLQDVS
jgi:hypothetical protein